MTQEGGNDQQGAGIVKGVVREALKPEILLPAVASLALICVNYAASRLTLPHASQTVYYDSAAVFPQLNESSTPAVPIPLGEDTGGEQCGPLTHIQYEVQNYGPGNIEDVKLVLKLTPDEADAMKFTSIHTGYARIRKNGTSDELIVSTQADIESASPLRRNERFGVQLSIAKGHWKPDDNNVVLRVGTQPEIRLSDASFFPWHKVVNWVAWLAPLLLMGLLLFVAYRHYREFKSSKMERERWEELRGQEIWQEAAIHTVEVLNESNIDGMNAEDMIRLLEEKKATKDSGSYPDAQKGS